MENLNKSITDALIESGAVSESERKLYNYYVEGLLEIGKNLIATLSIGAMLDKFAETVLFLLIMIPLRSVAGGYHAGSPRVCFVLSISTYLLIILLSWMMASKHIFLYAIPLYAVSAILLTILAPVDSKNKRLTCSDKKRQKKRAIKLTFLISILFALCATADMDGYCLLISHCMALVASMLIAGKIKNYRSGF